MYCEDMNALKLESAESIPSSLGEHVPVCFGKYDVKVPVLYGSVNLLVADLRNLSSTHSSVS